MQQEQSPSQLPETGEPEKVVPETSVPEPSVAPVEISKTPIPGKTASPQGAKPIKAKKSGLFRSPRFRRTLAFLLLAFVAWYGFTQWRVQKLRAQGKIIASRSAKFKTDYYVGSPKSSLLTYMVLGDSTAAGWGASRLEETYPYLIAKRIAKGNYYVHVVNVAQAGATSSDVCQQQLAYLWATHPNIISVSIGANDATQGTRSAEYAENLRTLLSALQNSDAGVVLFGTTPDMYQAPALPFPAAVTSGAQARRLNRILADTKLGEKVKIVDLYRDGKLVYSQDPTLYSTDLFHPSAKGYNRWADLYIKKLFSKAK